MPRRKDRIPVVLDTNVLVAFLLGGRRDSANSRTLHLWQVQRRLQLVLSPEVMDEYLSVMRSLFCSESRLRNLESQLRRADTVTHVELGPRPSLSRDPDDNLLLATAQVGSARFLVTHDRDLLDIPMSERRSLKFDILTPTKFLAVIDDSQPPASKIYRQ